MEDLSKPLARLNGLPASRTNVPTRVKVFQFRELDSVEKEINDWFLREKVSVQHVTQSQSEKQGWFIFVVSVFY